MDIGKKFKVIAKKNNAPFKAKVKVKLENAVPF